MKIEDFFNRQNVIDLSFFNFRNAITAAFYADSDLRILKVNDNFKAFFPVLGNVTNAYFPDVLRQLGVEQALIKTFAEDLDKDGHVLIPKITIRIDDEDRVYSLLSTHTKDAGFSYLNGIQGQFVDRTQEYVLRQERERLLEEKIRDREVIEAKTKQLENLANRLAKYLSPQIYNSIFTGSNESTQSFARKNLTVFFSDIEGFTDFSDSLEPERLAFVINTYLSEMCNIAIQFGGTIDKFIGDAILIFFGDPESDGEVQDAVKCAGMALSMQDRAKELRKTWESKGIFHPFRVRMGINTGFCTVGNFGSEHRLEYTVLGSPVNLAARLQGNADADSILISEATYLLIKDFVDCTPGGSFTPKGFLRPVSVHRLNGLKEGATEALELRPLTKSGQHVEVNVRDRRKIREAIVELKKIQEELESGAGTGSEA